MITLPAWLVATVIVIIVGLVAAVTFLARFAYGFVSAFWKR